MKNIFIAKIFVVVFLLLIASLINLTGEDVKFPGKVNVEYKCLLISDIIDGEPGQTWANWYSGENGLRHEMKGSVTFNVVPDSFM